MPWRICEHVRSCRWRDPQANAVTFSILSCRDVISPYEGLYQRRRWATITAWSCWESSSSPSVLTSAALPQPPAGAHLSKAVSNPRRKSYRQRQNSLTVLSRSRLDCLFEVPGADLLQSCAHAHSRKRKCSSVVKEEVEVQFTEKLRGLTKLPGHTRSHAMPPQPLPIPSLSRAPENEIGNFL